MRAGRSGVFGGQTTRLEPGNSPPKQTRHTEKTLLCKRDIMWLWSRAQNTLRSPDSPSCAPDRTDLRSAGASADEGLHAPPLDPSPAGSAGEPRLEAESGWESLAAAVLRYLQRNQHYTHHYRWYKTQTLVNSLNLNTKRLVSEPPVAPNRTAHIHTCWGAQTRLMLWKRHN